MAPMFRGHTSSMSPPFWGASCRRWSPLSKVEETRQTLIVRGIWYIVGLLEVLLAFRFVLALLGANPANAFAHFIDAITLPFVAPFYSLFGYSATAAGPRLEGYTLVTMAVYGLAGWGVIKLVTITRTEDGAGR